MEEIFSGRSSLAVALKGPRHWIGEAYSRIELEFPAGNEKNVRAALGKGGFDVTWYFEKKRTTFKREGDPTTIAIDEIPHLGEFIEIEGPLARVRQVEFHLSRSLGLRERRNYAELYRANMLERGLKLHQILGASFDDA